MANILIPLDTSKNSQICLDFYLRSIHREGNTVFICYVADYFGDVGVMDGPTPGRIMELEEQDKQKARTIEEEVTKIFKSQQINGNFKRLVGKEPWSTIINYSKEINANMIVIGSRGMGKIRRTILGSVSESVLHHSHVPVIICKHN